MAWSTYSCPHDQYILGFDSGLSTQTAHIVRTVSIVARTRRATIVSVAKVWAFPCHLLGNHLSLRSPWPIPAIKHLLQPRTNLRTDCTGCRNCTRCKDSTYCQNCTDCESSSYCQNCTGCDNCEGCRNCTDCTDCIKYVASYAPAQWDQGLEWRREGWQL